MEVITKKRPTSVTVIGWIFIIAAVLMVMSGGVGFLAFTCVKQMQEGMPSMPEDIPGHFKIMSIIFQHFGLFATLQIVVGIFVLVAGIKFLKLCAWARTALEVICWLSLTYLVGFGFFWVFSWVSMTSNIPVVEAASGLPPIFKLFGTVIGTIAMAVWAVPIIVIIKFLRGKTIKEAVSGISLDKK